MDWGKTSEVFDLIKAGNSETSILVNDVHILWTATMTP